MKESPGAAEIDVEGIPRVRANLRGDPWMKNYFTESRGTRVMLRMPMRLSGRSCGCVGVKNIAEALHIPDSDICRCDKCGGWKFDTVACHTCQLIGAK
jgi:hypothetical protein